MNRSIKFRAWNDTKKVMVYNDEDDTSDYWDGVVASSVGMVNSILSANENDRLEKYVWMQSTGLLDKNGKEIYEGDIICIPSSYKEVITDEGEGPIEENNQLKEVIFDGGRFGVFTDKDLNFYKEFTTLVGINENTDELVEIIGNIYENPELLK